MSCLQDIDDRNVSATDALIRLNAQRLHVPAGADILLEGDLCPALYLVESGWVYAYGLLPNGNRQIVFLYRPGDLAGLADFAAERAASSLRCLRDCVLYRIPMGAITAPSFLTPTVAMHLLRKSAQVQAILIRTLTAVGRMSAKEKIAWLILLLDDRSGTACGAGRGFEFPLNQSEAGDLVGLTNVSVNRYLRQLSDEGFIERRGSSILIRRRAELQALIGYQPMNFPAGAVFGWPGFRDGVRVNGGAGLRPAAGVSGPGGSEA